jgi:hypothetical protein
MDSRTVLIPAPKSSRTERYRSPTSALYLALWVAPRAVRLHFVTSVNTLIIDALKAEIERVRQDDDFTSRAKQLLETDRELSERLAQ